MKNVNREPLVQCFCSYKYQTLSGEINDFLEEEGIDCEHLIDIKYSTSVDESNIWHGALIIYTVDVEE